MRSELLTLLDDLAADERTRLTTREVRERLHLSPQAASNALTRLVEAGFLDRVGRGVFAPRPLGQLGTRAASEDVALAVGAAFGGEAHRIAFRSALDHHGLLVHPGRTIQVALPRRVKTRQISGRRLRPVLEEASTISLGAEDAGHGAAVSSVARALLESADRADLADGWVTLATALERASLEADELIRLSAQLDAGVALRRLASLAEFQGRVDLVRALRPPSPKTRVVPLDPREPADDPWTDRLWRVRWPVSARHARALVDA
jgi:predicted transcriptional regulator of viral defense system